MKHSGRRSFRPPFFFIGKRIWNGLIPTPPLKQGHSFWKPTDFRVCMKFLAENFRLTSTNKTKIKDMDTLNGIFPFIFQTSPSFTTLSVSRPFLFSQVALLPSQKFHDNFT